MTDVGQAEQGGAPDAATSQAQRAQQAVSHPSAVLSRPVVSPCFPRATLAHACPAEGAWSAPFHDVESSRWRDRRGFQVQRLGPVPRGVTPVCPRGGRGTGFGSHPVDGNHLQRALVAGLCGVTPTAESCPKMGGASRPGAVTTQAVLSDQESPLARHLPRLGVPPGERGTVGASTPRAPSDPQRER